MVVTTGLIEKIDGLHALNETKQGRGRKSLSSLEFGNFLLVFSPVSPYSYFIFFHLVPHPCVCFFLLFPRNFLLCSSLKTFPGCLDLCFMSPRPCFDFSRRESRRCSSGSGAGILSPPPPMFLNPSKVVWGEGKHDTIVRVRLASVGEMGSAVLRDARKKPPTGAGRKKGCVCVCVLFPAKSLFCFFWFF